MDVEGSESVKASAAPRVAVALPEAALQEAAASRAAFVARYPCLVAVRLTH